VLGSCIAKRYRYYRTSLSRSLNGFPVENTWYSKMTGSVSAGAQQIASLKARITRSLPARVAQSHATSDRLFAEGVFRNRQGIGYPHRAGMKAEAEGRS